MELRLRSSSGMTLDSELSYITRKSDLEGNNPCKNLRNDPREYAFLGGGVQYGTQNIGRTSQDSVGTFRKVNPCI